MRKSRRGQVPGTKSVPSSEKDEKSAQSVPSLEKDEKSAKSVPALEKDEKSATETPRQHYVNLVLTQNITSYTDAKKLLNQMDLIDEVNVFNNFPYPSTLLKTLSSSIYTPFTNTDKEVYSSYFYGKNEKIEITNDSHLYTSGTKGNITKGLNIFNTLELEKYGDKYNIQDTLHTAYTMSNINQFVSWILYNKIPKQDTNKYTEKDNFIKTFEKIKKVHVVAHNNIMKKFVKQNLFIPPTSEYKSSEVPLPVVEGSKYPEAEKKKKKIEFIITRHANSCNNIVSISKNYEPGLTSYGIKTTYEMGKKNKDKYTSSMVFVSCLLRTWETATLLYLQNIAIRETLTLVISPFLKEEHFILGKRGNYPAFIFQQFQLFHFFLSNCVYIFDITDFNNKNICIYLNKNFYATININSGKISWELYNERPSSSEKKYKLEMIDYSSNLHTHDTTSTGDTPSTGDMPLTGDTPSTVDKLPKGYKSHLEKAYSTNLWSIDFEVGYETYSNGTVVPTISYAIITPGVEEETSAGSPISTLPCNPLCLGYYPLLGQSGTCKRRQMTLKDRFTFKWGSGIGGKHMTKKRIAKMRNTQKIK